VPGMLSGQERKDHIENCTDCQYVIGAAQMEIDRLRRKIVP
jgi:hypothetical protein